jgi:hypothetical protein
MHNMMSALEINVFSVQQIANKTRPVAGAGPLHRSIWIAQMAALIVA